MNRRSHPVGAHPGATGFHGNALVAPGCAPTPVIRNHLGTTISVAECRDDAPVLRSHPVGAHPGATGFPGNALVAPGCAPTHVVGRLV